MSYIITDEQCQNLWTKANSAGILAASKVTTKTKGVVWINISGTTPFARWAKKQGMSTKALTGGHIIQCKEFDQSLEKQLAWADEVSAILTVNDVFTCVIQNDD